MKYLKKQYIHLVSSFPNFHVSGSISGMKKQYYGKDALLVRCGSWIYKVPRHIYDQVDNFNRRDS